MDLVVFGLEEDVKFFGLEVFFLAEDVLGDLGENGDNVFFEGFELGKVVRELLVDESEVLEELKLLDNL